MEIIGTHFSIVFGAWRLRLSFAVEDTDLQAQAQPALAETPLRLASADKRTQIFPNRR
jgi:hypothetical protein